MQPSSLSLVELNREIKIILKEHTRKKYWVTGEISELKVNYSGHCYLELIQKDETSDQILARSKATIWAPSYRMIKPYFETTTGQSLKDGLGILVKVSVEFHEVFGLSLNITDIEPTYTVGELAIRKQKIIDKLTDEGVFGMNKELNFPVPCQKIAVISSVTAAGYEDFKNQLENNPTGYKFYIKLFPAVMQGEESEGSIISALEKIYNYESVFDAVAIIRGGGSQADLSCFDSYWLAYHITQFPLPVLTGIGHEQDESVADMVAHTRLKTPTAVAAFLIDEVTSLHNNTEEIAMHIFAQTDQLLEENRRNLVDCSRRLQFVMKGFVDRKTRHMEQHYYRFSMVGRKYINNKLTTLIKHENNLRIGSATTLKKNQNYIITSVQLLNQSIRHVLSNKNKNISMQESRIQYLDPYKILNRGYSITKYKNKVLTNAAIPDEGEYIETLLYEGKLVSKIQKKK